MSAIEVKTQLRQLRAERALAGLEGLSPTSPYMTELDDEISATEAAYVCAAVTEIACLRAELDGRLEG